MSKPRHRRTPRGSIERNHRDPQRFRLASEAERLDERMDREAERLDERMDREVERLAQSDSDERPR